MEALNMSIWTLGLLIFIALAFDFMNGFHDGANSISTIVATGALTPKQASMAGYSATFRDLPALSFW
jgi:PiT family inorganic phosphate transporter